MTDPVDPVDPDFNPEIAEEAPRRGLPKWAIIAIVALVGLGIIGCVALLASRLIGGSSSAAPTPLPVAELPSVFVANGADLRGEPKTEAEILGKAGTTVTLIGRTADSMWITVRTSDGTQGWLSLGELFDGDPNTDGSPLQAAVVAPLSDTSSQKFGTGEAGGGEVEEATEIPAPAATDIPATDVPAPAATDIPVVPPTAVATAVTITDGAELVPLEWWGKSDSPVSPDLAYTTEYMVSVTGGIEWIRVATEPAAWGFNLKAVNGRLEFSCPAPQGDHYFVCTADLSVLEGDTWVSNVVFAEGKGQHMGAARAATIRILKPYGTWENVCTVFRSEVANGLREVPSFDVTYVGDFGCAREVALAP